MAPENQGNLLRTGSFVIAHLQVDCRHECQGHRWTPHSPLRAAGPSYPFLQLIRIPWKRTESTIGRSQKVAGTLRVGCSNGGWDLGTEMFLTSSVMTQDGVENGLG